MVRFWGWGRSQNRLELQHIFCVRLVKIGLRFWTLEKEIKHKDIYMDVYFKTTSLCSENPKIYISKEILNSLFTITLYNNICEKVTLRLV